MGDSLGFRDNNYVVVVERGDEELRDDSSNCSGMELVDQVILGNLQFLFHAVAEVPTVLLESVRGLGSEPCQ